MAKIDDGGPAFASLVWDTRSSYSGMALRDWFAGMALAGIYASRDLQMATLHDSDRTLGFEVNMAKQAYLQADAMIAAGKAEKS